MNLKKKSMKTTTAIAAALIVSASISAFAAELTPYGSARYVFRPRIHTIADTAANSNTTIDYHNLSAWRLGLRAKVDDQLSLQFQIGNDWGASEGVNWANNNMPGSRLGFNNLYVHLACFRWNPGYMFVEAGVVPLFSNGTLDLLERSINTGKYGEANYLGWGVEANNSMLGVKLGAPVLKGDIKVNAELFQTIVTTRTQTLHPVNEPKANPTAALFVFNLPVEAGALKVTPELTAVLNRNFNSATEKGDHEIIGGMSANYKVNSAISVNLTGGYGMVNNEKSMVGYYGPTESAPAKYNSRGLYLATGSAIKMGPGSVFIDFRYNSEANLENEENTKNDYFYTDLRYGWKVHDKVTITPRFRNYVRLFPENDVNKWRMENRPELTLEALF